MKINFLAAAAFAAALAMPLGATAQQNQPPAGAGAYGRSTPSEARIQHRWAKRLGNLNLSGDQQQRIQSIIDQYSQAHPQGSPVDRAAERALRQQVMGVLTSDQQNQLRQQMQARRAAMQQQGGQMQQQGPGDQQYQQGPPQQYQQGPPQQYQQGPPQQGPPDQQGPPPDQQGPDQGSPPG